MANNSTSVNLRYGEDCKLDDDCESKICEMTYKNGKADGRKCVKQALKYGKPCKTNLDCFSNRCVMTYGNDGLPKGKKCIVIKNLKRADTNFMGSATPKWLKDDKQSKRIKRNEDDFHFNEHLTELEIGERGPIAKFAIKIVEMIVDLGQKILKGLWDVWHKIFKGIWDLFFSHFEGWFGNDKIKKDIKEENLKSEEGCPKNYTKVQNNGSIGSQCKRKRYTVKDPYTGEAKKMYNCSEKPYQVVRFGMTILFPPFAVFMAKGITGWFHILICLVLTAMFYLPGMMYAFIIMNGSKIDVCEVMQ